MPLRNQVTTLGGLPIQIDYTARDYEAILSEMLKVATQLTPEWTDREPGDIGVTLLESVAYVADILSYQLDRVQNESYLATAQTREAIVSLLRLIGYELAPATPATVGMVIRTTEDNVTLPAGFTVRTGESNQLDSLQYQLEESVQLGLAGLYCVSYEQTLVTRTFNEASSIDDRLLFVAGTRVEEGVGVSDGSADQIFLLPRSPVCLGIGGAESIKVTISGDIYSSRESFMGTEPTDSVFVYKFLSTEEVLIKFGDGVNGRIPPSLGAIVVSYRIDGGEETNRAGVGSIIEFDNIQGVSEVYNVSQPSGGSDPEDVSVAKKRAPLTLRALDRCVTLEDFEAMALKTPGKGVRSARAVQGRSPLEVEVYIATEGDNPIPDGRWYESIQNGWGTLGEVGRWLNQKKPVPTRISVLAPTTVNLYLEAAIHVFPNLLRQTVEFDVDIALQGLINKLTNEFDENIPLSQIIQVIENTRGVDFVNVTSLHRIPTLRWRAGNEDAFVGADITLFDINEEMVRKTYQVEWQSGTTYIVRVSNADLIKDDNGQVIVFGSGATTQVSYYNTNASSDQLREEKQFGLSISVGGVAPTIGDIWEFSTDNYLGNIETKPYEIIVSPLRNDGRLEPSQFNLTYVGGI